MKCMKLNCNFKRVVRGVLEKNAFCEGGMHVSRTTQNKFWCNFERLKFQKLSLQQYEKDRTTFLK